MKRSLSLLRLWPVVLVGCAQERTTAEAGEDAGILPCGPDTVIKTVRWNEQTPLGVTPREAFGPVSACEARVRWDARWNDDFQVQPATGDTALMVRAAPVESTAELVTSATGACPPFLRVQADVHVETPDDTFGGSARSVLSYRPEKAVMASFSIPMDRASAMALRVEDPREFFVSYQATWHEHGCAGFIDLTTSTEGNHFIWALGDWSSTACWGRGAPVPVEDAELPDDVDALLGLFEGVFVGRWRGGQPAELHVQVVRDGDFACKHELVPAASAIPVKVRYSTTDGRIAEHEADGVVALTTSDDRTFLSVTEHLVCGDAKDSLAYPPCSELFHARLYLNLAHHNGEVMSSGQPALHIHEYVGRESDPIRTLAFELEGE
jgi:hypothetical protein